MIAIYLIGIISAFLINIVIEGKVVGDMGQLDTSSSLLIIKNNFFNYLIVTLILAVPIIAANKFIQLAQPSLEAHILIKEGTKALVLIISMYVFPVLFLRKEGVMAVAAGIVYFFSNLQKSKAIIPFVLIMFFLNAGLTYFAIKQVALGVEVVSTLPVVIPIIIVSTYLSLIVFTMATNILVENRNEAPV